MFQKKIFKFWSRFVRVRLQSWQKVLTWTQTRWEQDGDPSHPPTPHPPVATLGPGPGSFQKNPRICGKSGEFEKKWCIWGKLAGCEFGGGGGGGPWRIFPKSADFLIILKLIIFSRNLFNQKAALILYLGDAIVKQHLLLCGELWN